MKIHTTGGLLWSQGTPPGALDQAGIQNPLNWHGESCSNRRRSDRRTGPSRSATIGGNIMRNWTWALAITSFVALMAPVAIAQPQGKAAAPPPPWAYGFSTPPDSGGAAPPAAAAATPPDNVTQKHVEGSSL